MTKFGYGADQQEQFTTWAERELLPALRSI